MVDLHAMFRLGLGDHSHNYFLGKATRRQLWHANNFVDLVKLCLKKYKPGVSPTALADEMLLTSPMGLRLTKDALNLNIDAASMEHAFGLEDRQQILLSQTADSLEARNAFMEKRAPDFGDR